MLVKDYKYCIRHDNREEEDKRPKRRKEYRCQGYVNNRKRCRATTIGSFYCQHHKSQKPKKQQPKIQEKAPAPLSDEV